MKTLYELCTPRDSVFDETKRDDTLDLSNLKEGKIDVNRFIEETYITQGMEQLLDSAFNRFKHKGATGIIKLSQAMGGGKTHSMIMLGLLAMYPDLRDKVLNSKFSDNQLGEVRVVAFTGRESDVPYGIWGAIAEQLGKKDQFNPYYSPLSAPGQTAWIDLLKGEPLVILLDELPPYLDYARTFSVGNSDLSVVTTNALSNLFTAINKEELSNVCLVVSDLRAAYEIGGELLQSSFRELESEMNRSAANIEPVSSVSDEVYSVLKTRLFAELPSQEEINKVADGYKEAVKEAKQMGYTNTSPEDIFVGVKDSYPFHPSIKDLYARFKENKGFQQTRGLIKLMRHVVHQLYQDGKAREKYLIGVHDFDLNDPDMFSKVKEIKPSLDNAITHDIASKGKAIAESLDGQQSAITQDMAKLILVSSLADIPNALLGLSLPELIGYLCEPGRDISEAKDRLNELKGKAWYLHIDRDSKLHFKHVKNINAEINSLKDSYDSESARKQVREFLSELFKPISRDCYQKVLVFPGIDEIELQRDYVTLAIVRPYPEKGGLHPDLEEFFANTPFKNRIMFLTGQRNTMENLLDKAKEYRAINTIVNRMEYEEKVPQNDPQFQQATDKQDKARIAFLSSAKETFVTLFYPIKENKLQSADFLMEFTSNEFKGEEQIRKVLLERRKLETDVTSEQFRKKCEERLFTRKEMQWSEIKERAATNTAWQWHLPDALDKLKEEMIRREVWRSSGDYIDKGPFPKEKTSVLVQEIGRDEETGEATLKITPRHGDKIHYEINDPATSASREVANPNNFKTKELKLSFICVDSSGEHEMGEPVEWKNKITLKYDFYTNKDNKTMMKLASVPPVEIRYTTDGSEPIQNGALYEDDFEIPEGTHFVLAVGKSEKHGVTSEVLKVRVPEKGADEGIIIDQNNPLTFTRKQRTNDTRETYELIDTLKKHEADVSEVTALVYQDNKWIELNSDPNTKIQPTMVEQQLSSLRDILVEEDTPSITMEVGKIYFPTGQHFLNWIEENQMDLQKFKESEVAQSV